MQNNTTQDSILHYKLMSLVMQTDTIRIVGGITANNTPNLNTVK